MIKIVIAFAMLFLLFCAAAQNAQSSEVSDLVTVPFAMFGIIYAILYGSSTSAVTAAVLLITALAEVKMVEAKIGGADLLIYAGVIGFYGIQNIANLLLFPSSISLLIFAVEKYIIKRNILTKNGGIAFIPSVLLSVPLWTVLL